MTESSNGPSEEDVYWFKEAKKIAASAVAWHAMAVELAGALQGCINHLHYVHDTTAPSVHTRTLPDESPEFCTTANSAETVISRYNEKRKWEG